MAKVQELKIYPEFMEAQLNGLKNFEIRNWWRQTNEMEDRDNIVCCIIFIIVFIRKTNFESRPFECIYAF